MDDTRARADEDIALDSSRLRSSARLGSAASIAAAAAAAAATATAASVATTTTSTTSSTAAATCRVARRKKKKRRRQRLVTSNDDVPGVAVVVTSRGVTTSSSNVAVAEDNTATDVDNTLVKNASFAKHARRESSLRDHRSVPADVAKSKWKHLRDNFRNELKKTYRGKCDGIGGTEHDSKWVWFKSLFFLRDQMNSRVIGCALSQNCVGAVGMRSSPDGTQIEPQIDILEGHEETQFDDLDGDSCQSLLSNDDGLHQVMPPPKMNKIISRKRALMDAIENDYGVEVDRKRYESLQKRLAIGPEDEDDTYHFLMSVRNPLRSLPLDRQMFVRLKIQELVYNEINSQNQQQQQTAGRGIYDASSQGQDVKPPRAGNGGNGVVGGDVVSDMANPASLLQNCTPEGSGDDAFFG
ncbi:PREDICTED: uncharacterized protein LOC108754400 [Trachymyrmex septentrionalis]|uniref:uncharacterized protein LOC108754400 n=1 Tax=Trachymyrmex septentrionalis TaxID=34720 RepID=UPI00084F122D|nr:PREDICTED: uncharacterized protein LOC108754400 [Trachymyrmex septentrionalis]